MSVITSSELKHPPVDIVFTTNLPILQTLHNQSFGAKETDRLEHCSLAKSLMSFSEARTKITNVKIEKPSNGGGSIITVSGPIAFTDEKIDAIQSHIEHLLSPMNRVANPPINEAALKARLEQDEFSPNPNSNIEMVFASPFNEHTLPGVRGHGGYLKVKKVIDNGPNQPVNVELIAYGACMKCGSAGTMTLSQLHRLETDLFEQMSDVLEGRTFGEIRVYEEDNPRQLAYTVDAKGVHEAQIGRLSKIGRRFGFFKS